MSNDPAEGPHRLDPDDASPQRVLVVCRANVCRSPSMQLHLTASLRDVLPDVAIEVTSAGTDALPGHPMCSRAARHLRRLEGAESFVDSHRSQPLTPLLVRAADLVLVASAQERGAVAALSPEARHKTFGMREAALLLGRARVLTDQSVPVVTSPSDLVTTLVEQLHEQRGTLSISAGPAHFTARRSRSDRSAVDIGDVHQGQERRHGPVLEAIDSAAQELAAGLMAIAGPGAPVVSPRSRRRSARRAPAR